MELTEADRTARQRFFMISLLRFESVGFAMFGMAIWVGDFWRPGGWPLLGVPVFLIGVAQTFLAPRLLARRWRTPPAG